MDAVAITAEVMTEHVKWRGVEDFAADTRRFYAQLDEWDMPITVMIWSGTRAIGATLTSEGHPRDFLGPALSVLFDQFPPRAALLAFEGWAQVPGEPERREVRITVVMGVEGYVDTGNLLRGDEGFEVTRCITPGTNLGDAALAAGKHAWGKAWQPDQHFPPFPDPH